MLVFLDMCNCVLTNIITILQAQEAAVRAAGQPRDESQDLDKMLSYLGVAPVSG